MPKPTVKPNLAAADREVRRLLTEVAAKHGLQPGRRVVDTGEQVWTLWVYLVDREVAAETLAERRPMLAVLPRALRLQSKSALAQTLRREPKKYAPGAWVVVRLECTDLSGLTRLPERDVEVGSFEVPTVSVPPGNRH